MEEQKDFTIDNKTYYGLKEYFDELRSNGMRTIIILVKKKSILWSIFLFKELIKRKKMNVKIIFPFKLSLHLLETILRHLEFLF